MDEGIRRSDEGGGDGDDDDDNGDGSDGDDCDGGDGVDDDDGGDGGDAEGTYGVGGSQRGAMTYDSDYYTTQDTNHGGRPGISQQRRHLDWLVNLSFSDDYSSGNDNYSHDYHSLIGHLQG